jgi:hypothetical protein
VIENLNFFLRRLDVTSNFLTSINMSFSGLLAANNNLSSCNFSEGSILYVANLSGNFLKGIPSKMSNVVILDMSFNFVTSIRASTFVDMANLATLSIKSNLIET